MEAGQPTVGFARAFTDRAAQKPLRVLRPRDLQNNQRLSSLAE
jgi:hypothetical protein